MMIFSLVAMIGLKKCCITSACLQWLCHSGERIVARGPLVYYYYFPQKSGFDSLSKHSYDIFWKKKNGCCVVCAADCCLQGSLYESNWKWNSAPGYTVNHFTGSFFINLPLSGSDFNKDEIDLCM